MQELTLQNLSLIQPLVNPDNLDTDKFGDLGTETKSEILKI